MLLKSKSILLLAFSSIFLVQACATASVNNTPLDEEMDCEEILSEMKTLHTKIKTDKSNEDINRTVNTGASVAVTGASMAGVPYVGGVFSIARTLMNHNKQSTAVKAQRAEVRMAELQDLAYEKGCL